MIAQVAALGLHQVLVGGEDRVPVRAVDVLDGEAGLLEQVGVGLGELDDVELRDAVDLVVEGDLVERGLAEDGGVDALALDAVGRAGRSRRARRRCRSGCGRRRRAPAARRRRRRRGTAGCRGRPRSARPSRRRAPPSRGPAGRWRSRRRRRSPSPRPRRTAPRRCRRRRRTSRSSRWCPWRIPPPRRRSPVHPLPPRVLASPSPFAGRRPVRLVRSSTRGEALLSAHPSEHASGPAVRDVDCGAAGVVPEVLRQARVTRRR